MKIWELKRVKFFYLILIIASVLNSTQLWPGSNVPFNQLKNCRCGKEVWSSYKNKKDLNGVELSVGVAQCQCLKENSSLGKNKQGEVQLSVRVFCNQKAGDAKKSFIECAEDPDVEVVASEKRSMSDRKPKDSKSTDTK